MSTSCRVSHEVYDEEDDAVRVPSEIFMVVPSRKEYPDYYKIITKPIDLKTIHEVCVCLRSLSSRLC